MDCDSERARDNREMSEDMAMLRRYKMLAMIGTGNYARVYKALLLKTNKSLAIKAINLSKTTDNYRQKFLPRELSVLRRINHENICKIYEIVQVAERIYIVMQFCSRGTIADLLQKNAGPFGDSVVRFLFVPTISAVMYLHSNDIAHRDIKIENILLDQNFTPKLTDFSYACIIKHREPSFKDTTNATNAASNGSHTRRCPIRLNETFCGTLPYLSPEMIRKQPYDAKKTDAWSLGICLFVLLNDRLPFPFSDIKVMVRKQMIRDYEFRPSVEISDAARELIGLLLDPEPTKRISVWDTSRHTWFNGPRERPPGSRPANKS